MQTLGVEHSRNDYYKLSLPQTENIFQELTEYLMYGSNIRYEQPTT